jgi:hypothetical protein
MMRLGANVAVVFASLATPSIPNAANFLYRQHGEQNIDELRSATLTFQ